MSNSLLRTLLYVALLFSAAGARAEVSVKFDHPEEYFDMPVLERDRLLKGLTDHFKRLGEHLPAGQDLRIEVTDLHLAGRTHPGSRLGGEVRFMHGGADWPSMHLRYTVEANGQALKNGEEDLSNMDYLQRMNNYPNEDNLRYEKQMLDDWYRRSIAAPAK